MQSLLVNIDLRRRWIRTEETTLSKREQSRNRACFGDASVIQKARVDLGAVRVLWTLRRLS